MKVYRLEREGQGVFRSGAVSDAHDRARAAGRARHRDPWDPPSPCGDRSIDIHHTEVCGFRDLKQYRQWFNGKKIRKALADAGVKLCVYNVDPSKVRVGHWQCVFPKSDAQLISTRSCAI